MAGTTSGTSSAAPGADLALATHDLTRTYGPVGVHGVDLAVPRGTVYGLVGRNGAGKTTLLSLVAGLRRPDRGTVDLGVERRRVAVCPDVPEVEPWLTAREAVTLAGALAGEAPPPARVGAALARVGLDEAADRRVGRFSRGMTQRLGLACALVGEPELLLLDEPTAALDPAGRREVLDLVASLAPNATVVFSSHVLADVQRVCSWIGVLDEGRLRYQGPTDGLLRRGYAPAWVVRLRANAADTAAAAARLASEAWVLSAEPSGADGRLVVRVRDALQAERALPGALAATGLPLIAVEPQEADLEAAFLALTDRRSL